MDAPKNYALVDGGVVINIIWLSPENADEFPGAVCVGDQSVTIGDIYQDGAFARPADPEIQPEGEQPA